MEFKKKLSKIILITALPILTFSLPARACHPGTFNDSQKDKADVVFVGRPIKYKLLRLDSLSKKHPKTAQVTFKVLNTSKGEKKFNWKFLVSSNIDTTIPKNLEQFIKCYTDKSEVGLMVKSKEQSLPKVVQGPCQPPYILPVGNPRPSLCIFE